MFNFILSGYIIEETFKRLCFLLAQDVGKVSVLSE